jgi:hypothetical protein
MCALLMWWRSQLRVFLRSASLRAAAYVRLTSGKSTWLKKPLLSTTGAVRLEDVKGQALIVQIATKSMLLNAKTGRRIVDECISPAQRELIAQEKAAKTAEPTHAATEDADSSLQKAASAPEVLAPASGAAAPSASIVPSPPASAAPAITGR